MTNRLQRQIDDDDFRSQEEKLAEAIGKLTDEDRADLRMLVRYSTREGGDGLDEPLCSKAVNLGLAYESTGRLRPLVFKFFQGGGLPAAQRR